MQYNLLELEDSQGNHRVGETSHWLRDLANALVGRGEDVAWWHVTDERSPWLPDNSEANERLHFEESLRIEESSEVPHREGESGNVVHGRLGRSRVAATLLQDHLLPRLRSHGEVAVVGHGEAVASWMVALDYLLRAAGAREQVVLVWVAPADSTFGPAASAVDWDGLKRACSIVAPNPRIRQELTARRVGSMVIERGEEAARKLVSEHTRRPTGRTRGGNVASGAPGELACG